MICLFYVRILLLGGMNLLKLVDSVVHFLCKHVVECEGEEYFYFVTRLRT